MQEGYSHELSSCGYWPGGVGEGFFYGYAYPERHPPLVPRDDLRGSRRTGWLDRSRLERPTSGILAAPNVAPATINIEVSDLAEEHCFEAKVDGQVAGTAEYVIAGSVIVFSHTEADPAFAGRGVGAALARHSLEEARRRRLQVTPICPFYRTWIERHPEYHDTLYRPR
jgi:predicted GNAT family acetyltransferase